LKWIEPGSSFALNSKNFTEYYQKKTDSSARWSSIKNILTRSKSGFYSLPNQILPDGYQKIYTHKMWSDKPRDSTETSPSQPQTINISPLSHEGLSPVNQSVVQPVITETMPPTETSLSQPQTIKIGEIFHEEIIPCTLLKNQPNVWDSYLFNAHKFLEDMKSLYNGMNDNDIKNIKIFFESDNNTVNDINHDYLSNMPTDALHDFGIRFGQWDRIVHKVREFIQDGASDWFIGKCTGEKAAEILSKQDYNCFCIRTVKPDPNLINEHIYIFALSHWKDGKISHFRIFKDKQHRLCALDENHRPQYFHSFKRFIEQVKETSLPVGDQRFITLVKEDSFPVIRASPVIKSYPDFKPDYVPLNNQSVINKLKN